jgi:hypothetical protein
MLKHVLPEPDVLLRRRLVFPGLGEAASQVQARPDIHLAPPRVAGTGALLDGLDGLLPAGDALDPDEELLRAL